MTSWFETFIGSDSDTILWWQMCIRGVLIFLYALFLVRVAGKRVFGKQSSFDIVLAVILGSIMSRSLTANARFFPTLAAATVLVLLHILLGWISFRSRNFGHLVKGKEIQLYENGDILWDHMKKSHVTEHDLRQALRMKMQTDDFTGISAAFLERSGEISFIRK